MFGLSLGHLLILSFVVLLFGSRRLPELGSALGKGMRAFKRGLEGEEPTPPSSLPPAGDARVHELPKHVPPQA